MIRWSGLFEASEMKVPSVERFLSRSRIPVLLRSLAAAYGGYMPAPMLSAELNPWVAALIQKTE